MGLVGSHYSLKNKESENIAPSEIMNYRIEEKQKQGRGKSTDEEEGEYIQLFYYHI